MKKYSLMQLVLTVVNVMCLVVGNILAIKQFNIGFLTCTTTILVFPVTYILSDLFSEVYGYKWSRVTCYIAFGCNLFASLIFALAIKIPGLPTFENQAAMEAILGSTLRITIASIVAFWAGDLVNDVVFEKMRVRDANNKMFGLRAILSSVFGDIVDGIIFAFMAFFGVLPMSVLLSIMVSGVPAKIIYEIIILPITTYLKNRLIAYEGKL